MDLNLAERKDFEKWFIKGEIAWNWTQDEEKEIKDKK